MSRLFGMGDSKQIENTEKELQNQMQATKTFSDGINMECWLDQLAKIVLKTGKLGHSESLILHINREIRQLYRGKRELLRDLGKEESGGMQHRHMKDRLNKTRNVRVT